MVNWSDWQSSLVEKSLGPYEAVMGMFFWVIIFTAIIGYVYVKQQSYTAAAVASLILVSALVNHLYGMEAWTNMIIILMSLAFTGLLLIFISKRRN